MKKHQRLMIVVIACLTLGLAPFSPEPHIWVKLKWLASGGNGMQFIDYWDTFMHGAPWLILIILIVGRVFRIIANRDAERSE
jgi:hypothetical protein